jgi:formamidopyrimidine-DNA glycosylase
MPEGPEVRRYADALAAVLEGERIASVMARTRGARAWLEARPGALDGRVVERIRSHGKNLIGWVGGGYYFHSHLMMWGRWQVVQGEPPAAVDRRERARITVAGAAAILYSAPVFELGEGDPYERVEYLRTLGPDVLPYAGAFDRETFLDRLTAAENRSRTVGAALLDQRVTAGIGNYLRAEILFACRLDPWRRVADLAPDDLARLCETIPELARRAYETGGATVSEADRSRLRDDPSLVYSPGREWGTRHYVFRRTNLPCLECGGAVRQLRQVTAEDEEGERTRIMYFCPSCQSTTVALKPPRRPRAGRTAAGGG